MSEVKPRIMLVAHTPNPERVIADSARLCYADDDKVRDLFLGETDLIEDAKMIDILVKMRHLSPIEHASWTFFIEGVSRAMTHQLVRHRIASYSQRSQRYVAHKDFDYIIPDTIKQAGLEEEYKKIMERLGEDYERVSGKLEEKLGLAGESRNQDARYLLPNACETKINVTMNGRELLHFFGERTCNRAQWEIRDVAKQMLELAYPTAPALFSHAGPACVVDGKCYQGKKTCGEMEEVKKYFSSLK